MLILLAVLVVAAVLIGLSWVAEDGASADDATDTESRDDAVERHLGTLNYGTTAAAERARRQLLSLGATVVSPVTAHLERVESAPQMLTPATQLRLETLVADFGLAGLIELRRHLRRIDEQHAAYPSVLRIIERVGPHGVEQMLREDELMRWRFFDATVWRMPADERRRLADAMDGFAPSMAHHAAWALAVADGAGAASGGGGASALRRVPGAEGARARSEARRASSRPLDVLVRRALDDRNADAIDLPEPWAQAWHVIDGTAPADVRERVFAWTEEEGELSGIGLLAMACALPDSALHRFQRQLRTGERDVGADSVLPHVCARLGARAERLAVEVLRTGQDGAGWSAWHALRDVDVTQHAAGLAAAHARRRGDALAMGVAALAWVHRADLAGPLIETIGDRSDDEATRGAMSLAGILGVVDAVAPLLDAMEAERLARDAARAIELIGPTSAGEVHRWCREHPADAAPIVRVRAMVTGLAERRLPGPDDQSS